MKRIKAACLLKTVHFQLKEDLDHTLAVSAVRDEVAHYRKQLERHRARPGQQAETDQRPGRRF